MREEEEKNPNKSILKTLNSHNITQQTVFENENEKSLGMQTNIFVPLKAYHNTQFFVFFFYFLLNHKQESERELFYNFEYSYFRLGRFSIFTFIG